MIKLEKPNILFDSNKIFSNTKSVADKPSFSSSKDAKRAVILYQSATPDLSDAAREMLDKMMQACKFANEEVAYVNAGVKNLLLGDVINQYSPEVILVFGNPMLSRNMQAVKKNVPFSITNVQVLVTEPLEKLLSNTEEKKKLWVILQKLLSANV